MNFEFSKVSWERCVSPKGFNMDPVQGGNYDPMAFDMFILISMAEEMGEIAGAMKKIIRGFNPREFKKTQRRINDGIDNHPWSLDEINQARFEEVNITSISRYIMNQWLRDRMAQVTSESADFMIYFDLFLTYHNINIHEAVKKTFNKVSDEMECPQFKIP